MGEDGELEAGVGPLRASGRFIKKVVGGIRLSDCTLSSFTAGQGADYTRTFR